MVVTDGQTARNDMDNTTDFEDEDVVEIVEVAGQKDIQWFPILLVAVMLFGLGTGLFASNTAQIQLYEDIICRDLYDANTPSNATHPTNPANPCKSNAVQGEVAQILGWAAVFDVLPGVLLAIPYGALADTWGRRFVLNLSFFGLMLGQMWILFVTWTGLPLRLVWGTAAFTSIGGGATVASASIFVIASDATPEASRSRIFFYIYSSFILSELCGPVLGGYLIQRFNVWVPIVLGICSLAFGIVMGFFVPETMKHTAIVVDHTVPIETRPLLSRNNTATSGLTLTKREPWYSHIATTLALVFHSRNISTLALSFLVTYFAKQSLQLLIQYVSVCYGWSISKASYFASFRAFSQLVCNLAILPAVDWLLLNKVGMLSRSKDLFMVRVSLLLMSVAFFILALAPNIWVVTLAIIVYTLGSGFVSFARSLVSSLVAPDMIGTLYTALAVADSAGVLLAGPLVAEAFREGLEFGGIWRGLPWMASFVLCLFAGLMLTRLKISDSVDIEEHSDDDEP